MDGWMVCSYASKTTWIYQNQHQYLQKLEPQQLVYWSGLCVLCSSLSCDCTWSDLWFAMFHGPLLIDTHHCRAGAPHKSWQTLGKLPQILKFSHFSCSSNTSLLRQKKLNLWPNISRIPWWSSVLLMPLVSAYNVIYVRNILNRKERRN